MSTVPEPEDRSLVLFEYAVDLEVWFRSDSIAEQVFGEANEERWLKAGDYDADPLTWDCVLGSNPDIAPVLLERVR